MLVHIKDKDFDIVGLEATKTYKHLYVAVMDKSLMGRISYVDPYEIAYIDRPLFEPEQNDNPRSLKIGKTTYYYKMTSYENIILKFPKLECNNEVIKFITEWAQKLYLDDGKFNLKCKYVNDLTIIEDPNGDKFRHYFTICNAYPIEIGQNEMFEVTLSLDYFNTDVK